MWLRENPHDVPLPQLALDLARAGGAPIAPADVTNISQTLDLWSGVVTSSYSLAGTPTKVTVAMHPARDILAVRIESALVANGRLGVRVALPRGMTSR
jgi:hypothetical protein